MRESRNLEETEFCKEQKKTSKLPQIFEDCICKIRTESSEKETEIKKVFENLKYGSQKKKIA